MTGYSIPTYIDVPEVIWSFETILSTLAEIDHLLSLKIPQENNATIAEIMLKLSTYYPNSINCVTSAKWYLDAMWEHNYNDVVTQLENRRDKKGNLPPVLAKAATATNIKKMIDSKCKDFSHLFMRAERINKAITHRIDALRSVLSKNKAEMTMTR